MTNEEREKQIRIANMLIGTINDLKTPMLMYQVEKDVAQEALENYIKMLEQQSRDCKTCKHSKDGKCAYTEECHTCMWENQYEPQPCEDCISRTQALEMLGDEPENWTDTEKEIQEVNDYRWFRSILENLPSVAKKETVDDCISRAEVLKHSYIIHSGDGTEYSVVRTDEIINSPLVTPEPKLGHWIGETICSNCNHIKVIAWKYNFCPICGIKMEVDDA